MQHSLMGSLRRSWECGTRSSGRRTRLGAGLVKLVVALRPSNWRTEGAATDMVAAMAAIARVGKLRTHLGRGRSRLNGMECRQGRGVVHGGPC